MSLKTVLDKFNRRLRFIDSYEPVNELWNLICPLFGDTRVVQRTGLVKQFRTLKDQIKEKNQIGLIVYGTNLNDDLDRIVDDYPTINKKVITLTIRSICTALINEHIEKEELEILLNNY